MKQTINFATSNLNIQRLPLFAAAERRHVRSLPLPARRFASRLGLPSATALMQAEAASFCVEEGSR